MRSDPALVQVGAWLRSYHDTVADFVPAPNAVWRAARWRWRPGDVVGHNDAAPYNAVWQPETGRLVGFVDWDFAAPCSRLWDLALVAFSWVPLHARRVVIPEGFTDFAARSRRLRLLLDAYGFPDSTEDLIDAVRARVTAHAEDVRDLAAAGDPMFIRLVAGGVLDDLHQALVELSSGSL